MSIDGVLSTLQYWLVGIILFIVGYYAMVLLCKIIKVNLNQVIDDHNTAAGVAMAGFIIAIGIIISGAIQ
ncbi:DUF350 domain-containing protein [Bacteroides sp. 224]|uniref:DUF350 domain-containing protein n=1 Tax=Bacteroides sp. 224 TaxID=2302936 RepID=UPI0013D76AE7|nr:DUF350 domain-containing protein [Bacteroides sp. 224]NDV65755.1 DUF350 domain-containing protein [Bacteroides sp. 224]